MLECNQVSVRATTSAQQASMEELSSSRLLITLLVLASKKDTFDVDSNGCAKEDTPLPLADSYVFSIGCDAGARGAEAVRLISLILSFTASYM